MDKFFTSRDLQLDPYIGPVQAVRLRGLGLGLEASKTLQAGETLLISTPLACVVRTADAAEAAAEAAAAEAEQDNNSSSSSLLLVLPLDDEIEELANQLTNSKDAPGTKDWLQYLDDGSLEHNQSTALPDLTALATSRSSSNSSSNSNSTAEQQPSASSVPPPAAAGKAEVADPAPVGAEDDDRLLDIADLNARVLVEDELLAAQGLAGDDGVPKTLVGVWPELGLLRHSCSPNASVVLHQSCAVVTAGRGIPKQAGVYQNLLGSEVLTPLQNRRGLITDLVGTTCGCLRCKDEAKQDPKLLQLVSDIYEACLEQIQPDLEAAVENDDDTALEGLRDQLAAFCEVVDAGFSKLGVKQQSQVWLQASLFKMYELTAITVAACGSTDPQLIELLAALAAEVSPGSPEHLFWAQQYRNEVAADEEAYFDGAMMAAEKRCYTAFQLRYGRTLSTAAYRQMLQAAQVEEEDGDDA